MEQDDIIDDKVILHRISDRCGSPKQRHFKLREGELGVSCNRSLLMTAEKLVAKGTRADARVAEAAVRDIRQLGLNVVAVEDEADEDNPGHFEIRSGSADLNDAKVRDELAKLFKWPKECSS